MGAITKRLDKLAHSWNAFRDQGRLEPQQSRGYSYGSRPDRVRLNITNERSIVSSIYTRIGIDVAAVKLKHIKTDANDRFISNVVSGLNYCLNIEANIDQAARAFRQDIAQTLFDKGVAAIIPVDTSLDPNTTGGYNVESLRVGEIVAWFPRHVRVSLYNDQTSLREEITLPKSFVAIIENPLYSVMNEPNSTLQRLTRKLALLDSVDEASSSGKLDIIIQLPYVVRSESRKQQAEMRRSELEEQLAGGKYGIAYADGTEKITQLNRAVENKLLPQVEYLTKMLYSQLGITPEVFDGTASEAVMLNYYNRTLEPILGAITEEISRKFLTKTARTQGHTIRAFRDPFALVAISSLAELADKFTRNEILSSNEMRGVIGYTPSDDAKADELRNKNLPQIEPPPTET